MSNLLGTDLHPTTSYHPQANSLIERNHRDLKASLKCSLSGPNWVDELPWVLLRLRTAPKEDLRSSSAELVYGSPLTVPGDFFPDSTSRSAPQELKQQRERVGNLCPVPTDMEETLSSLTFRAHLNKQSLFLSDMMLQEPHFKLRMMVLLKFLNVLLNISLCNSEIGETRFPSTARSLPT